MRTDPLPNGKSGDNMKNESKFSAKRAGNILAMTAGLLALSAFYMLWFRFTVDTILAMLLLHGIFFPVFLLVIVSERKAGRLGDHVNSSYRMIRNWFLAMLACYFVFPFLPAYCAPVILPAIFLAGASTAAIGMAGSIYLDILLCMVSERSYFELAAYLILSVCGCLLASWLEEKQYRFYLSCVILGLNTAIPSAFYFFGMYEHNLYLLIYSAFCGVISCLAVLLFFPKVWRRGQNELVYTLREIIEPDFPLVEEIRNFSELDYMHARNVSKTAYQCALLIGADADTAAAAGFYYRLGKLEGEPFVQNGVRRAQDKLFPQGVIEILGEYNGEEVLPQTRESAIVHMVDAVVTKFELLDRDTVLNSWNHDIVIYQTLDEKSSSGIYDQSGLSMNQYLKIREYLVKGVTLQ